MAEQERPTGITYEAAMEAADTGESVAFEGRQARVVDLQSKSGVLEAPSTRLTLDLGDEYLVISGYFSRDNELIETAREHPFREGR